MAKGKKKAGKKGKRAEKARLAGCATVAKLPKKKCCESKSRCNRCPLRMLKEGTLPPGYTVKKRKLVKVDVTVKGGKPGKADKKGSKKAA